MSNNRWLKGKWIGAIAGFLIFLLVLISDPNHSTLGMLPGGFIFWLPFNAISWVITQYVTHGDASMGSSMGGFFIAFPLWIITYILLGMLVQSAIRKLFKGRW